jgi:peptidyl-prolyl cis-trans isomerase B (cyclophilin B)
MKIRFISFILLSVAFAFTTMSNSCNNEEKPDELTESTKGNTAISESNDAPIEPGLGTTILMTTNYGEVTILLYDETPIHRDNFIKLVKEGFYDGLLFHRIIKDFMIQGGDPDSKGAPATKQLGGGGPGYTLKAEIMPEKYIHKKGALSAARMGDNVNPMKESSGSQFYIVTGKITPRASLEQQTMSVSAQQENALIEQFLKTPEGQPYMTKIQGFQQLYQQDKSKMNEAQSGINAIVEEIKPMALKDFKPFQYTEEQKQVYETIGGTPFLDGGYTVFGEVLKGLEIVEQMGNVATNPGDRPKEDVKIISMKIISK